MDCNNSCGLQENDGDGVYAQRSYGAAPVCYSQAEER